MDRRLTEYKSKSVSLLRDESIDEVLDASPETTFIHELSHATPFLGDNGILSGF